MQAVVSNHARCIAMSTQNIWQPLNWFSDMWSRGIGWKKIAVDASQCPRITKEFLAEQLSELGTLAFEAEFYCSMQTQAVGAMFPQREIERAIDTSVAPLFRVTSPQ